MRPRKRSTNDAVMRYPRRLAQHVAAFEFEIFHLFQIAVVDQKLRLALEDAHAAPDFGNQHAVVVIHAVFRADVPGGGGEAGVAGEDGRDQRVVDDRPPAASALNGPLVSAPSLPKPVVEGDLPVRLQMKSMNSSGSS